MKLLLLISLPLLVLGQGYISGPCSEQISALEEKRVPEGYPGGQPGLEDPLCDSQGYYLPKQCSGAECYCVDRQGIPLGFSVSRWQADEMMCECAIAKSQVTGYGVLLRCDKLGNYHHTQCTGSQCYCVHPHTGETKVGTESNIADLDKLEARCASVST